MPPSDYLLDTNAAIALISSAPVLAARLDPEAALYVPVVVLGELYYGANKSSRPAANVAAVDRLCQTLRVLDCDIATARLYGMIENALRSRGRPIPQNDVWIAAAALEHDLTVVTRDAHFREVENLRVAEW